MRKVVAFLQARTDSTRLPKKVLKPLLGKAMILHQLERVSKSKKIDNLILLTSKEKSDDNLAKLVTDNGFDVFRGSKDNVLERFYECAKKMQLKDSDVIVRLTGDCPLQDPLIVDELINSFLSSDVDYMANCIEPVYPDGFDAEVFTYKTLKRAYTEATKPSEKEHVTPYIRESNLFKTKDLKRVPIHPEWRLTVDELKDFKVIENIYNHFKTNSFSFQDIVLYLENNLEVLQLNNGIPRNEGYKISLEKDKNYINGTRLILEPLQPSDITKEYLEWINDFTVVEFTEARWNKYTLQDLQDYIKDLNISKNNYIFKISIKDTGKYIGNVKIGNINYNHKFADLGIIIGAKEEWGKGYATEAIKIAIEYAFNELGLYKLTAGVYNNNRGSIKALYKAGFYKCGQYKKHCIFQDTRVDVIIMEIINNKDT